MSGEVKPAKAVGIQRIDGIILGLDDANDVGVGDGV